MQHEIAQDPNLDPSIEASGAAGLTSSALAALANLATRLGVDTTTEELRRRFAIEAGEPDTETLIGIARDLGLEAKSLKLSFAELPKLSKTLPAILRAKDGSALILEAAQRDPMKGSVAIIRDPSAPTDELIAIEEVRLVEFWEGEVILVKRSLRSVGDDDQPFGPSWLVRQVLRESKIFRDLAYGALASTIFVLAPPFTFMIVIDKIMAENSFSTLNVITVALLMIIAADTAVTFLRGKLVQVVTTRLDGRLSLYMMKRILKLPMDYFENNPTGRSMTKLNQAAQIRNFLTGQLFGAFLDTIPILGLVPAMLFIEWHLALFAFALSALIFIVVMVFIKPLSRAYHRVITAEQARNAHMVETLYGMKTIKSLALEGRRSKEWDKKVAEVIEARHALGLLGNYPITITAPLQRLIYVGSYAIGAYLILYANMPSAGNTLTNAGQVIGNTMLPIPGAQPSPGFFGTTMSAGALVAFAMLSRTLASPLVMLATLQQELTELKGSISLLASILNVPPEVARPNGLKLPITGEITFKDICFRYAPEAPYALDHVSFTVPQGTVLGIMGRSGSGKTTVTRLLQRLHSNYEGMIKVDGMDLREMDLMHLRTHIGVVPQENFLFSGSIRDNISMARPNASFLEVVRAAQLSGAEEFIERLPRGYETLLEEGATNLSGGQRQRLAIARALLIDPPVLILDEATSALDAESEAIVNANLKRMAKGRSVITISHRLSMLIEADAILVLERGKVYDIGTHEELVRRCDIYKHMWYQQNRHLDPKTRWSSAIIS